MRLVDENEKGIQESDVDLEKGKLIQTTIIKQNVVPIDNVTKFAYEDDDYESVMMYIRIPDEELITNRIDELKRKLTETDYCVLKMAEGAATEEEYADVIAKRKEWRAEINALEAKKG